MRDFSATLGFVGFEGPLEMGVGGWLALVLAVACAWPAFRAMRIPTRVALAYE